MADLLRNFLKRLENFGWYDIQHRLQVCVFTGVIRRRRG